LGWVYEPWTDVIYAEGGEGWGDRLEREESFFGTSFYLSEERPGFFGRIGSVDGMRFGRASCAYLGKNLPFSRDIDEIE
jgi:hypothetical protein